MTDLTRVKASDPVEDVVTGLQQDGAVIVEGLLDAEVLARFNAELDPLLEEARPDREFLNPAIAWFFGQHTRHMTAVASKSRVFATEILCHPTFLGVCDAILAPSCARYQLNIAHVLDRGPGAEPQLLHRDELVWVHMPRPHPELQVASMIALVDFERRERRHPVVPGSHRWPHRARARTRARSVDRGDAGRLRGALPGLDHPRGRRQHDGRPAGGAACT